MTRAITCDFTAMSPVDWLQIAPEGGFQIIFADPCWNFTGNSVEKPGRNARQHYGTMKLADIEAMPVHLIAAKHALLLMWVTVPFAEHAMRVMRAWGFPYKSQCVWPKNTLATGYYARNRHELLYIGRRGKFPVGMPAIFPDSLIPGRVTVHSRKPEWPQDTIDRRFPEMAKAELFARRPRAGWTVLGNEIDRFGAEVPA